MAVLLSAYREDKLGGEKRVYLALKPAVAPVKVAVFPLVSNKEKIMAKANEVYNGLCQPKNSTTNNPYSTVFDDIGNIGKRYRRQDEIGTPWCVTIDYQTLEDDTVTIRDRDTGKQTRHAVTGLDQYFHASVSL